MEEKDFLQEWRSTEPWRKKTFCKNEDLLKHGGKRLFARMKIYWTMEEKDSLQEWRSTEPWRKKTFCKNEYLLKHGGKRLFALNYFLITNPNSLQNAFNESVPCKSCLSLVKIMEDKNQWHGLVTQPLIVYTETVARSCSVKKLFLE